MTMNFFILDTITCLLFVTSQWIHQGLCDSFETTSPQLEGLANNGGSASNQDSVYTTYNPSNPADCNYDFTGPAADIFIIDRSESVSEGNFNKSKEFVEYLIRKAFILRPDKNRVAIITYTNDVTMKMNLISASSGIMTECELFLTKGLWHSVTFDPDNRNGENLDDALTEAQVIFSSTERSNIKRRLWIITDFRNTNIPHSRVLSFPGVEIYGVGVGAYNLEAEDQAFYNLITEDPGCRYRKLYREPHSWDDAKIEFVFTPEKARLDLGDYVPVSDDDICIKHNCTTGCSCQEFNPLNTLRCLEPEDEENDQSFIEALASGDMNLIIIVLAAVFALIFIIICVLVICCCCMRCKNKNIGKGSKYKTKVSEITSTETGTTTNNNTVTNDASTYTSDKHLHTISPSKESCRSVQSYLKPVTTDTTVQMREKKTSVDTSNQDDMLYMNGDLADILMAHGIVPGSVTNASEIEETKQTNKANHKNKYKKNPNNHDLKVNVHHYIGDRRIDPSRYDTDNKSIDSHISDAPSSHSYFEPIADYPKIHEQKGAYSYAYMNSKTMPNSAHRPKSPASNHSYEGFEFNTHPKTQKQPDVIPKSSLQLGNNMDSELTSKLQRIRKRISGAFATNNNPKEETQVVETNSKCVQRFPNNIPIAKPSQMREESNPMYIDPSDKAQNALPLELAIADDQEADKRKSGKMGTLKFKKLLYKFTSSTTEGEDDLVKVSHINGAYEHGPNGPYSVVNHFNDSERPQTYREIL